MELFRQEYELNLPRNWGKKTFLRLQQRELESLLPPKATSSKVLAAIQNTNNPVSDERVLNITTVLTQLTDEELVEYFEKVEKCSDLIMQNWKSISDHVLRSISMVFGEELEYLDLSYSSVSINHLEILLARVLKLKVIRINGCKDFDAACMAILARVSSSTLIEVYADGCEFRIDPLLILGGCIGFNSPKFAHLTVISLASCPVVDKGEYFITHVFYAYCGYMILQTY